MRNTLLILVLAGAFGCMGSNEIDVEGMPAPSESVTPDAPTAADPDLEDPGLAFVLPRGQVQVLPFQVRLAKVARVAGVSTSDAILQSLRSARLELGDGDYANGIRPDKSWTSAKMASWVKALRPVCQSVQLKARFTLPKDLPAMIMTAYGRWADAADEQAINEELQGANLSDDEQHEMVCLAVLSSTEFVSR